MGARPARRTGPAAGELHAGLPRTPERLRRLPQPAAAGVHREGPGAPAPRPRSEEAVAGLPRRPAPESPGAAGRPVGPGGGVPAEGAGGRRRTDRPAGLAGAGGRPGEDAPGEDRPEVGAAARAAPLPRETAAHRLAGPGRAARPGGELPRAD